MISVFFRHTLVLCLGLTLGANLLAQTTSPTVPQELSAQIKPLSAEKMAQYGLKNDTPYLGRPTPSDISAKSWIVVDLNTYQVLAFRGENIRIAPYALTQLMTAFIAFDEIRAGRLTLDKRSTVVPTTPFPSSAPVLHLDASEPLDVKALLDAMAILNAYDAAQSVAILTAGNENQFVEMMNRQAQSMGLVSTQFTNASGQPNDRQSTTVSDMVWLASALIKDFPDEYNRYASKAFTYRKVTQQNHNTLLWLDKNVDGLALSKGGKNVDNSLVASAHHGARRILVVVAKAPSDNYLARDAQKLLNFGFQAYDAVKLFKANQAVRSLTVWKGNHNKVNIGFAQDFIVSLPRDRADAFKLKFVGKEPLVAPVSAGQTVGALELILDEQIYAVYPVVALNDVPVAGWFGRTWDTLYWWLKK